MAYEETCRYLSGRDYAEHTDAQLEMFQTLMSNSGAAEATTKPQAPPPPPPPPPPIYSGNNRGSVQFWSGFDPDFMPTAYPLMRSNARSQQPAKWGVLNLAASAALLEQPLKEFDSVRNKRPRFRLGPRILEEDQDGFGDRNSVSSTASSRSRSALDTIAPRYSFIAQDGKLVEREVRRWPRQKLPNLMVRYKVCEPYASNYGKRSVKRAASLAMRPILPSTRRIYERPIYMVPRSIVNDNKRRLLARHAMKDIREPGPGCAYRLPAKVTLQEGEQCKRYREHQAAKYIRETRERIEYEEQRKEKHRQAEASFSSGTISPSAPVS
uniref:Uncharacterized protein n=1 Tax=Macrostomum lignano TaxID=282301 RepID=A0A1I8G2D4_9PLAT